MAGFAFSSSFEVACAVVLFLVLFAASPFLIQLVWPARELAGGALRNRLEALTARLQVRLRTIGVWGDRTRYRLNASAVGLLPGTRSVLLTQGLCDHFTEDEIIAVFSHELAHLKRGHLVSYAIVGTVFLLSLAPFEQICLGMNMWFVGGLFAAYALRDWGFVSGVISRRLALEADLTAVDMIGFDTYAAPLKKMSVFLGPRAQRAGWRHLSVEGRLAFLHAATDSPEVRRSFFTTTRRLRTGINLLLVLALGGWLCALVSELHTQ